MGVDGSWFIADGGKGRYSLLVIGYSEYGNEISADGGGRPEGKRGGHVDVMCYGLSFL